MNQTWVREYLEKYMETNQCQIIERAPSHMTVKLSVDVDKDITNRPYYWTFVERTGTEPETLTMTFIFDSEKTPPNLRGEELRFGSERLKQFFHSTKNRGRLVRLFQQSKISSRGANYQRLSPWLGVNFKVEFRSYKKKDKIISLGMNLATAKMENNFYKKLTNLDLSPVLPPNILTDRHFLTYREAALQLEEWVLLEINKEKFDWVIEAEEHIQREVEQLEAYYENHKIEENLDDEKLEEEYVEKEKRIDEVKWKYSPKVLVKPINFGIFYLKQDFQNNVEYIQ